MLGEADGMQDVSDKMACALGSAPLFGMIGGPELGHAFGDKASFACLSSSEPLPRLPVNPLNFIFSKTSVRYHSAVRH